MTSASDETIIRALTSVARHSLPELIAWLATRDPDERYNYTVAGDCAVARFLKAKGDENFSLVASELDALGWKHIAQGDPSREGDERWTMGAALKRARSSLAKATGAA